MTASFDASTASIIPTLRYRDVPRAIDWLCAAFGFEKHLIVDDADGGVLYAELAIGGSMIMLGPAEGSAFDGLMKQPDQLGGVETQICYLYVADAEAHRQRALAAGAEIVLDIDAEGYIGRGYSCRDPEGHIWNFGTYNPWTSLRSSTPARRYKTFVLSTLLLLAAAASGLLFGRPEQVVAEKDNIALWMSEPKQATPGDGDKEVRAELAKVRTAKEANERALRAVEEQLALERSAHVAADRSLQTAEAELAKERTVVASISSGDRAASEALERERAARLAAEKTLREVRDQLHAARSASQSSERALGEARAELARAAIAKAPASEPAREERLGKAMREASGKPETGKHRARLHTRMARYRAARLAARARVRRLREAREPMIKPPLPYF